jgi:hypothetical protein
VHQDGVPDGPALHRRRRLPPILLQVPALQVHPLRTSPSARVLTFQRRVGRWVGSVCDAMRHRVLDLRIAAASGSAA